MLNPVEDLASSSEKFPSVYRAEVIDVNDSMTSGRVKVRVHPMMYNLDAAVLPWAAPAFDLFEGGKAGIGSYTVPSVGSHVFVFFENGNVTQPVYFASAMAKTFGPPGRTPDKKIWKSRSGHLIEIDDTSGSEIVRITHKNGLRVELTATEVQLGSTSLQKLVVEAFVSLFNSHKHSYTTPLHAGPPGQTGTPASSMSDSHLTEDTKAS